MNRLIDRLMAKLGYVPAAALGALAKPGSIPLKIEVDDSQVREALALLEEVTAKCVVARAALAGVGVVPSAIDAMTNDTAARAELCSEMRRLRRELRSVTSTVCS